MKLLKRQPLNLLACLVLLTACGGEGAKRDVPAPPATAETTAAAFSVIVSSSEIKTGTSDSVTIKALAKDAGNAAVANVPVGFSSTGGLLSASSATTDATGFASVTLSAGDDIANKTFTITTVVNGKTVATSDIALTGTALSIGGASSAFAGQATNFVVTLKDAAGKALANKAITATVTGGTLASSTGTTNASGQTTFAVTPSAGSGGSLTVSALGASATNSFVVSTNQLQFTAPAPSTLVPTGTGCQAVSILTSTANQSAKFSINRGQLFSDASCTATLSAATSVPLSLQGTATVYARSAAPGDASVDVTSGGSSSLPIKFVSVTPSILLNQVSPAVVSPGGSAVVTALVKDANGNAVEGLPVYFSVPTGNGSVSPTSALTDGSGVATISFKGGSAPTAQNGVKVTASADGVADSTAMLTISSSAVSVSLGTDTTILTLSPSNSYQIKYTATLADSSGAPLSGQQITLSRRFTNYLKGFYRLPVGTEVGWQKVTNATCAAEDTNGDGLLTAPETDLNANGKIDPDGDARLSATADGSNSGAKTTVTTGADGSATIYINFLQSYAAWPTMELTASASVNGLNSTAVRTFTLPVPASVINDTTNPPPFVTSPFGVASVCSTAN